MSLLEQHLPMREIDPGSKAMERKEEETKKNSYRDSLPGAPKPICSRQSYDGSVYEDMYNDEMIASTKEAENGVSPPALPQKSALRASRILDGLVMKLPEEPKSIQNTTPHDLYLSSEEDASSSADDFSDYGYESDSEESSPRIRKSHEDIARIVSVVYSGRPSIVDVTSVRRSISPNSIEARRQSSVGSLASSAYSSNTSSRRMSISSTVASSVAHPPRTTSMGPELLKNKPQFLSIDPFASRSHSEPIEEHDEAKTPKTPTSMFKKTMTLMKKRSRPMLNTLVNNSQSNLGMSCSHNNSGEQLTNVKEEAQPEQPATPQTVTYNDIIRAAKKNAQHQQSQPQTPISPTPSTPVADRKSRLFSGLSMGRRRSIHAKFAGF